ncbi:hypothetical protein C8J57DRAFT_8813 [Mycena rebaudengoi]|nr:hypothetical protein C8J57DRAFT_8813 [Mycena rebaudengoi]
MGPVGGLGASSERPPPPILHGSSPSHHFAYIRKVWAGSRGPGAQNQQRQCRNRLSLYRRLSQDDGKTLEVRKHSWFCLCSEHLGQPTVLSTIPIALWSSPSLIAHLETRYFAHTTYAATEKEEEEEEEEDLISVDDTDMSKAPHICLLFYRSVQAVCAWNRCARYLIGSTIAQNQVPIHLSMLDLPREPVNAHSAQELLARWTPRADWSESLLDQLKVELDLLQPLRADSKGAVHCEAGLVMALYLHQQRDRTDLDAVEPEIVTKAFASLSEATEKLPQYPAFAIGIAKKYCPICKMLIDILQNNDTSFKIEYGGNHSRYYPWPPLTGSQHRSWRSSKKLSCR